MNSDKIHTRRMLKNLEDEKETKPEIPKSNKQQWPHELWTPGDHVTHTATPEQQHGAL